MVHLHVWVEALECIEHGLHVWLLYIIQGHRIVHFFELGFEGEDHVLLIIFIRLTLARITYHRAGVRWRYRRRLWFLVLELLKVLLCEQRDADYSVFGVEVAEIVDCLVFHCTQKHLHKYVEFFKCASLISQLLHKFCWKIAAPQIAGIFVLHIDDQSITQWIELADDYRVQFDDVLNLKKEEKQRKLEKLIWYKPESKMGHHHSQKWCSVYKSNLDVHLRRQRPFRIGTPLLPFFVI